MIHLDHIIHLDVAGSRRHRDAPDRLMAQARPVGPMAQWGRVAACAPREEDLVAVQAGSIDWPEYRRRCVAWFAGQGEQLKPQRLSWSRPRKRGSRRSPFPRPVSSGSVLCCTCAAPGSRKRRHNCHLELLVTPLLYAGWHVVSLWGRPLVLLDAEEGPVWADTGEPWTGEAGLHEDWSGFRSTGAPETSTSDLLTLRTHRHQEGRAA